ncbi:MAG: hypothetical protein L0Y57_05480 [Beijerinckiaceae bacterium]|nr:hypothetical protein [Beijerinckiaceae bacterium]
MPGYPNQRNAFRPACTQYLRAAERTGRASSPTARILFLIASGVLTLFLGQNEPRAGELLAQAELLAPLPRGPNAAEQPVVMRMGIVHTNALGKPCLAYDSYTRARVSNSNIFDYLVSIRNNCPQSIKVRICHRESFDCSRIGVHSYQFRETVMGFGPKDLRFAYTAKEDP